MHKKSTLSLACEYETQQYLTSRIAKREDLKPLGSSFAARSLSLMLLDLLCNYPLVGCDSESLKERAVSPIERLATRLAAALHLTLQLVGLLIF
jgi:hypothetical protein